MLSKKIVKYIQSLSHKKYRDEEGVFIAEGPKVIAELLASQNFICKIVCAEKEWLLSNKSLFNTPVSNIYEIDENSLKKMSLLKTPNKVIAVFSKKDLNTQQELSNKITLALDGISDPGNIGTIIRIADWFAIENVICSEDCVDCYNPKVIQSTMGSLARVNILYTDLKSFFLSHKNISIYAATLSGKNVSEFKSLEEGFILIGNESKGISKELLAISKNQITIPRYGNAESLNAAVATGIILSHMIS
ncbi:MAG TPA: RNA methyltransferase [Chitinophagaceae bacterium]|nr:RNA methyltransferase [Chitinophagaceae bacterium]